MDENTLKDKINQHLKIYRKNVEEILAEINLSIEDLDLLLKLIAVGGMEVVDLPDYLIAYKPDLTIEQANNLQSKLYNKVFIDIDDELKEQRANFLRGISRAEKEIQATEEYGDDFVDPRVRALLQQFEEFLKKNQALGISQAGVSEDLAKSNFYNAINNQDKQKFLASLVQFFSAGKIAELFRADERYIKFWRDKILKSRGLEAVAKFDENPAAPRWLGEFIKYVLEQRFQVTPEESVLWGTYLAALAHKAGENKYGRLAYGDIKSQQFKWNV